MEQEAFCVVIMDLTIPGGMGGKETIQKLRNIDPMVKGIVSSGYSNDPIMASYERYGFGRGRGQTLPDGRNWGQRYPACSRKGHRTSMAIRQRRQGECQEGC